jgi:hypothetical protein
MRSERLGIVTIYGEWLYPTALNNTISSLYFAKPQIFKNRFLRKSGQQQKFPNIASFSNNISLPLHNLQSCIRFLYCNDITSCVPTEMKHKILTQVSNHSTINSPLTFKMLIIWQWEIRGLNFF